MLYMCPRLLSPFPFNFQHCDLFDQLAALELMEIYVLKLVTNQSLINIGVWMPQSLAMNVDDLTELPWRSG